MKSDSRIAAFLCGIIAFLVFVTACMPGITALAAEDTDTPGSTAVNPIEGSKDQIMLAAEGIEYSFSDGSLAKNIWIQAGSELYYFDENGIALHDQVAEIGEKAYFFNANGICEFGCVLVGDTRYYFTPAMGIMYGFVKETDEYSDQTVMYFCDENANGAISTGWFEEDTKIYYADPETGIIQTGICRIGDQSYGFDENGVRLQEWNEIDGEWYYFDPENDCAMAVSQLILFTPYNCMRYLKEDGTIAQNETIYINGIDRHFGSLESVRPTLYNNIVNNIEYLIAFFVSAVLIIIGSRARSRYAEYIFYFLGVMTLALLAGFRSYAVGYDISIYVLSVQNLIQETGISLKDLIVSRLAIEEPLFLMLQYFSVILFDNSRVFLWLISFITCGFVFLGIKNSFKKENYWLAWLVYCFVFYCSTLDLLRQMVAVAMVFYLFSDPEHLTLRRLAVIVLIATGFHYSAVFAIPVYIILRIMRSEKTAVAVKQVICILALVIPVLLPVLASPLLVLLIDRGVLNEKYNVFVFNILEDSLFTYDFENLMITVFCLAVCILSVILEKVNVNAVKRRIIRRRRFDAPVPQIDSGRNAANIFLGLLDLVYAATANLLNIRFQYYVSIFKIRYFSNYLESKLSRRAKAVLTVIAVPALFIYWYYAIVIMKAHSVVPFEFCF